MPSSARLRRRLSVPPDRSSLRERCINCFEHGVEAIAQIGALGTRNEYPPA